MNTDKRTNADKPASDKPANSRNQKLGDPKTYAWKSESGADITVEVIGSRTVMSKAFAEAHLEIAAHAAEENAKLDAIFAARAEPKEA